MDIDIKSIGEVAKIVAPFTQAVVDVWLKPKISRILGDEAVGSKEVEGKLSRGVAEYLTRSYERVCVMNTIVFGNEKRLLNQLYIPLTVQCASRSNHRLTVVRFPDELFKHSREVLITDTAGMGKSTLMKYIFLSIIDENKGIPIFVELRSLRQNLPIATRIFNELNSFNSEITIEHVYKMIEAGDFIFLFDGFDEIPIEDKESIVNNIRQFVERARSNRFVLTSRPEQALSALPEFLAYKIRPLDLEQACALIKKYDENGRLSKNLIKTFKGDLLKHVKDLLTNPMLVSLLYKAYSYKPVVPFKKHVFYRQVYDALYENHDLTKEGALIREKASGLDIEDFHAVLRSLAFVTIKLGKVEYTRDEIVSLIDESVKKVPRIELKASDFLRDLITTVPLFVKDGEYYRWSHKSIQEYFCACFISFDAKDNTSKILHKIASASEVGRYYNLLDLLYDIDYITFRKTVIIKFIEEFLDFCSREYRETDFPGIASKDLLARSEVAFATRSALIRSKWLFSLRTLGTNPPINHIDLRTRFDADLSKFNRDGKLLSIGALTRPTKKDGAALAIFQVIGNRSNIASLLCSKKELFVVKQHPVYIDVQCEEEVFLEINSEIKNPLNTANNFTAVTSVMSGSSVRVIYDKAKEFIDAYKRDVNADKESGGLADGF